PPCLPAVPYTTRFRSLGLQHPSVVDGHDLAEPGHRGGPVLEQVLGHHRAGLLLVTAHDRLELDDGLLRHGSDLDHLAVDLRRIEIEHPGGAAAHAGGDVAPGRAEDHDAAAGHVLQRVVTDALDDGGRPGVAHAE